MMNVENIPLDVVPLIFEHLTDRRDLYNCIQSCRVFRSAATPFLYRNLDSRIAKTRTRYEVSSCHRSALALCADSPRWR